MSMTEDRIICLLSNILEQMKKLVEIVAEIKEDQ